MTNLVILLGMVFVTVVFIALIDKRTKNKRLEYYKANPQKAHPASSYADIERQRLVGTKVMHRSNEDDPLLVGTLSHWDQAKSSYIPIVEANGQKWGCMGIVLPYSEIMFELLSKMPPKEQWKFLVSLKQGMMTFNTMRNSNV